MPTPRSGGAATPPIMDAAITQAPALFARGRALLSHGSPVGKTGAMKTTTPAYATGAPGDRASSRGLHGHPGRARPRGCARARTAG